jgi:predicted PurR-regulated permease PerM
LVRETGKFTDMIQEQLASGQWRNTLEQNPRLKRFVPWIESQLGISRPSEVTQQAIGEQPADGSRQATVTSQSGDEKERQADENRVAGEQAKQDKGTKPLEETSKVVASQAVATVGRAAEAITGGVGPVLSGTIWLATQLFIMLMSLFFFLRDRHRALGVARSLMPLSNSETDEVFSRVDDTIHAMLYGSLVVALVQGTMGGLMFWWLGLPAPLVWGAVMSVLAVVPVLGTFVVWAPTAVVLAAQGDTGKALILVAWGGIAIALVDNLLYPFLVGKRLRFHTLLVFFAIVGGLTVFGASGLILGPLLLAFADALLEVWRRRTAFGHTADGNAT